MTTAEELRDAEARYIDARAKLEPGRRPGGATTISNVWGI